MKTVTTYVTWDKEPSTGDITSPGRIAHSDLVSLKLDKTDREIAHVR